MLKREKFGFDRKGMYHKLDWETDTYSRNSQKYDEDGYSVYGFDYNGRNRYGGIYNEKGFRREVHGGKEFYLHKNGEIAYDFSGYDVDGFNGAGFNRDGINKATLSYYAPNGCMSDGVTVIPLRKIFKGELSKEEQEKALIEWIVIYSKYNRNIENQNWYKALIGKNRIRGKKILEERVCENCEEMQACIRIENDELLEQSKALDEEIETNEITISEKEDYEKSIKQEIQKLISILNTKANEGR